MKKVYLACTLLVLTSLILWGQTLQHGSFTDSRDGQIYSTVKIGEQVWLAQNLNYATKEGSWTIQGDSVGTHFGRFYTWEAAKEAVPEGWHLPSKEEFEKLAGNFGVNDLPNWGDLYPLITEGGSSGLNVLLTGSHNNAYGKRGKYASFWSSEEGWFNRLIPFLDSPWRLSVRSPDYVNIGHGADSKYGFNVRCIKDE